MPPLFESAKSDERKMDYLHHSIRRIERDHGEILGLSPFPEACPLWEARYPELIKSLEGHA